MSTTDGHWIATDYDYFGGAEASKGWAPEYIDRLSIPETDQHWKFARAWTLGEVITALLGADLRLDAVAEHPIDWWGGHARRPARGARPDPAVVLGGRRAEATGAPDAPETAQTGVSPANRPSGSRSTRATARIAVRAIGP